MATTEPKSTPDGELSIRVAAASDTPALLALAAQLQDAERELDPALPAGREIANAYLAESQRACEQHDGVTLVAERRGLPVGYVVLLRRVPRGGADEPGGDFALVRDLVVDRRQQRGGVGRALLAAAIAEARAAHASELRVELLAANGAAAALYAEAGFVAHLVTLRLEFRDIAP